MYKIDPERDIRAIPEDEARCIIAVAARDEDWNARLDPTSRRHLRRALAQPDNRSRQMSALCTIINKERARAAQNGDFDENDALTNLVMRLDRHERPFFGCLRGFVLSGLPFRAWSARNVTSGGFELLRMIMVGPEHDVRTDEWWPSKCDRGAYPSLISYQIYRP